ncbi:hypothetical protein B0H12DRAFT_1073934 [Mycena haematopus]|nr:hypothetical protein B0H12DRAFT_1073934 [Mycena haematopus]
MTTLDTPAGPYSHLDTAKGERRFRATCGLTTAHWFGRGGPGCVRASWKFPHVPVAPGSECASRGFRLLERESSRDGRKGALLHHRCRLRRVAGENEMRGGDTTCFDGYSSRVKTDGVDKRPHGTKENYKPWHPGEQGAGNEGDNMEFEEEKCTVECEGKIDEKKKTHHNPISSQGDILRIRIRTPLSAAAGVPISPSHPTSSRSPALHPTHMRTDSCKRGTARRLVRPAGPLPFTPSSSYHVLMRRGHARRARPAPSKCSGRSSPLQRRAIRVGLRRVGVYPWAAEYSVRTSQDVVEDTLCRYRERRPEWASQCSMQMSVRVAGAVGINVVHEGLDCDAPGGEC